MTVLPSLREVDLYSFQVRVLQQAMHKPSNRPSNLEDMTNMDQADTSVCLHALCRDS